MTHLVHTRGLVALGLWLALLLPAAAQQPAAHHDGRAGAKAAAGTRGVPAFPNQNWHARWSMPGARWAHASAASHSGVFPANNAYLYVIGGADVFQTTLASVSRYDVAAGQWTAMAPLPLPRRQFGAAAIGAALYVPGGTVDGGAAVTTLSVYDIAANAWTSAAPMPQATSDYALGTYADRYVYVVGGSDGSTTIDTVQVYDTRLDTWSLATPKPGATTWGLRGAIVGNRIVVAGGYSAALGASVADAYVGTIDASNPTVIAWSPIAPYPSGPIVRPAAGAARAAGPAGGLPNSVFFTGGDASPLANAPLDDTWAYDLDDNTWKAGPGLPVAVNNIHDFTGIAFGGKLHMVSTGGYDGDAYTSSNHWLTLGDETPTEVSVDVTAPAAVAPDGSLVLDIAYGAARGARGVTLTHVVPAGTQFDATASAPGWTCTPDAQAGSACTLVLGTSGGDGGSVAFAVDLLYPTPPAQVGAGGVQAAVSIAAPHGDIDPQHNADSVFVPFAGGAVAVAPTSGLLTGEDGSTAQFDVSLAVAPTTNVMITLASSNADEGVPSAAQLLFTPANWSVAQAVTVTGIDDGIVDGDVAYTIDIAVVANTGNYAGVAAPSVHLQNLALPLLPPRVVHVDSVRSAGDDGLGAAPARVPVTQIVLQFDAAMQPATVETLAAWRLLAIGDDGVFDTVDCAVAGGGDDVDIALADVTYASAGAALRIGDGRSLRAGQYRLIVCDSLTDLAGTALDGNGDGVAGGHGIVDFAVATTNLLQNPNVDRDLLGWQLDGTLEDNAGFASMDADDSPFSGSVGVAGDGLANVQTFALSQCLPSVDFGAASARVRLSSTSDVAPVAHLELDYFAQADCAGKAQRRVTSAPAAGDADTWRLLRVEASELPASAVSARFSVHGAGDAGTAFTLDIDDAQTDGTLAIFANGFEAPAD